MENINHDVNINLIPIIELERYHIGFMAPYNGFLYVKAEEFKIKYGLGNSEITVKNNLEKFYIAEDTMIFIENPINLQHIRFVSIE